MTTIKTLFEKNVGYIENSYLPLTAGTEAKLTDELWISKNSGQTGFHTERTDTSNHVHFGIGSGGVNRGIFDHKEANWLFCRGGDGSFNITAKSDSGVKYLTGTSDGILSWDGNLRFTNQQILINGRESNDSYITMMAGKDASSTSGAKLYLNAVGVTGGTLGSGAWGLQAGNASGYKQLIGRPNGDLMWDNSYVLTSAGQDDTTKFNAGAGLVFDSTNLTSLGTYHRILATRHTPTGMTTPTTATYGLLYTFIQSSTSNDGCGVLLQGGGQTMISSGEAGTNLGKNETLNGGLEQITILSDNNMRFCTAMQTYANRREYWMTNTDFYPNTTNTSTLGKSGKVWKQLFAGTTTISTSDERLKQDINLIDSKVIDAWGDVNWYEFRFKDSIAEKGEDSARYHTGLIAQRIKTVFENHGIDPFKYGILCYDEWGADDETGTNGGYTEAGNKYSVRYEEALCLESAYQRRKIQTLEERLEKLENLLSK